jgi:predicted TIM-barrel fold metal-dependent hydrolase
MTREHRTGITVDRPVAGPVVDVDAHYSTSIEGLVEYMDDAPARRRFEADLGPKPDIKTSWPKISTAEYRKPEFAESDEWWDQHVGAGGWDPPKTREDILAVMGELQVDKIFLFDDLMLSLDRIEGRDERSTVYANAYVDYMLDQVVDPDRGIYTGVPIPHQNPDEAAELVERVGDEPGIAGVVFMGGIVEPPLGDRRYDQIYDAAESHGLPIVVHGDAGDIDNFYLSGFSSYLEVHNLGFLWGNLAAITSILVQGVPEKFPGLDFVFLESGVFYVPAAMYRLDAEYLRERELAPLLDRRPSEYMKESFYFGTQPLEEPPRKSYFADIIEMLGGADRLLYASDYPHSDYDVPTAIGDLPGLSDADKRKILGANAEAVFGI